MKSRKLLKLFMCAVVCMAVIGMATSKNVYAETDYTIIDASTTENEPTELKADGVMYASEFDDDEALYFTLTTGKQSGYYYFYMYNASCDYHVSMQLTNSTTGEDILDDYYSGSNYSDCGTGYSKSINVKLLTNRKYNFKMYNDSYNITGYVKYYVKFVPDTVGDTRDAAKSIKIGQTISGNIGGDGDVDYYKVKTGVAGTYVLTYRSIGDSDEYYHNYYYYLTNEINQEIESGYVKSASTTAEKIEVSLLANRTYYIKIEQAYKYGNYRISLSYKAHKPSVTQARNVKLTSYRSKMKLTWSNVSRAKGYQIQYSSRRNFKGAKTKTLSKSKRSYVIRNLKSKKKYYVRVRAYKTYRNKYGKVVRAYGKWTTISKKTK